MCLFHDITYILFVGEDNLSTALSFFLREGFNIGLRTDAARCRKENGRFSPNQFLYYYSGRQLPAVSP